MSEGKPRPDIAFIESDEGKGKIEEFCENNYEEHKSECVSLVADKLRRDSPQPTQQAPEPEPPAPQNSAQDPVMDAIMGEEGNHDIETLVADCVGTGFLGMHRPNTRACMRVVAKHEREKRL